MIAENKRNISWSNEMKIVDKSFVNMYLLVSLPPIIFSLSEFSGEGSPGEEFFDVGGQE